MSKPDLDSIIQSPEAETFLRMVTKGFYNNSYTGSWIYEVIGREWDEMRSWAEGLRNEIHPQTCTWSIGIWEWVYGFEADESSTLEERRQRILSKILGIRPINPEMLRRGIAKVSGADAEVTDLTAPYRFGVTLNVMDKPVPLERVLWYIRTQKPAHLAVSVEAVFPRIESTLSVGGPVGNNASISVPGTPDVYDLWNTLHTGGSPGSQMLLPIPDDASPLPATTVLRTGGVCTIISNKPPTGG